MENKPIMAVAEITAIGTFLLGFTTQSILEQADSSPKNAQSVKGLAAPIAPVTV